MITFGNISLLAKAVTNCYITPVGEMGAASSQLYITQLAQSITEFKTIEPGRSNFKFFFIDNDTSSGVVGTQFLVDYGTFKQKVSTINSGNYSTVTLDLHKGIPRIKTDFRMNSNNKTTEKCNLTLKAYNGSYSDFMELPEPTSSDLFCSINTSSWNNLIDVFLKFGNFSTDKFENALAFSRTISVELNVQKNLMRWSSNSKEAYGAYTSSLVSINTKEENEYIFAFEGRILNKLKSISSSAPVEIYIYGDLISFKSDLGQVTTRKTEAPINQKRDEQLFQFPVPNAEFISKRKLTFKTLLDSLALTSLFSSSDLLLYEDKEESLKMVFAQGANLALEEESYVDISPEELEGEWEPLLLNALSLQLISKAFKSSAVQEECLFTQYVVRRVDGNDIWLLYFSFENLQNESEIVGVVFARSGLQCFKEIEIE